MDPRKRQKTGPFKNPSPIIEMIIIVGTSDRACFAPIQSASPVLEHHVQELFSDIRMPDFLKRMFSQIRVNRRPF